MEELESTADSQGESPFGEVRSPRLSIRHLMLWTLCSAVYLSLIRAMYSLQGDMPSGIAAIRNASSVLYGIFTGATLMGAIVLVSTRVRCGPPMLRQPGHWFLFVSAISHLLYVPFILLLLVGESFGFSEFSYMAFYGITSLFLPIAYTIATRRNRVLRWKVIFAGVAVVGLSQCLLYLGFGLNAISFGYWFAILSAIPSLGSLVLAGAVVVVSILDMVAGERRDWLHWTGVATHVAGASVILLWMIGARLLN